MSVEIQQVDRHLAGQLILEDHGPFAPHEIRNLQECLSMMHRGWAGYVDEKLICVWALCPPVLLSNTAWLWMYHTDNVKDHQFVLIRHSQLVMEQMLNVFPIIEGRTAISNPKAIRWLEWLGAKFVQGDPGWKNFRIVRANG